LHAQAFTTHSYHMHIVHIPAKYASTLMDKQLQHAAVKTCDYLPTRTDVYEHLNTRSYAHPVCIRVLVRGTLLYPPKLSYTFICHKTHTPSIHRGSKSHRSIRPLEDYPWRSALPPQIDTRIQTKSMRIPAQT
jgi:hypothetical protein